MISLWILGCGFAGTWISVKFIFFDEPDEIAP